MLTYTHVLNCLYPRESVEGGRVRAVFMSNVLSNTKKSRSDLTEFDEVLIRKSNSQMTTWLAQMIHWLGALENDKLWLVEEDTPERSVMESFPMNDTSCFAFNRKCPYFDLCESWGNPLQHLDSMPADLEVSFWDPTSLPTIREVVELK